LARADDDKPGFQPSVCFSTRYLGRCPQAGMSSRRWRWWVWLRGELGRAWQGIKDGSGLEGILCGKKMSVILICVTEGRGLLVLPVGLAPEGAELVEGCGWMMVEG
jgi:hypothetical protein